MPPWHVDKTVGVAEFINNQVARPSPPDLIMKSPEYTMRAVGQDARWRPSVATGLTEPRWVRAIEIRPVGT